ncbi:uncharacterized protein EAF01_009440 [Botrytis porri]|uniref:uncharacterized protein n=1 Tax=Botrytis porri TaxID=87229 RepID=UPI001900488F|nr:uncharacterized protein EAF01_009440 [Botrytis porri]KAF7895478.1 hypothetical protein EAF01_009440 [Botrytis porri]
MSPALSTSPASRICHLTPNPRLHLQFFRHSPSKSRNQGSSAQQTNPALSRRRSYSTSTAYRTPWAGRPASENAGTDGQTEKHNVQHDQSQKSKEERVKGESGSVGLDEKPSGQSKDAKKKVQVEFPEGAKRGPVIGMEDERGGKGS